jgi:signal transduction histidine kinase
MSYFIIIIFWLVSACLSIIATFNSPTLAITDVSTLKWAENLQKRQLIEADETRRAQNNFIDITSHEMRNPLSAIVQCADGIASALSELLTNENLDPMPSIKESILAAETIQLCAQHQKSIVDEYEISTYEM